MIDYKLKDLSKVIGLRDDEFVYDPTTPPFDGGTYLLYPAQNAQHMLEEHFGDIDKLHHILLSGHWDNKKEHFICAGIHFKISEIAGYGPLPEIPLIWRDDVLEAATYYVFRWERLPKPSYMKAPGGYYSVKAYQLDIPRINKLLSAMHMFTKQCDDIKALDELPDVHYHVTQNADELNITDYVVENIPSVDEFFKRFNLPNPLDNLRVEGTVDDCDLSA